MTRTTGKPKSGIYGLTFKGNDGTFSVSPSSVSLPLNTPVTVKVTATPTAGGHSATMLIDDPKTKGLDGSMMAVVAAGETFAGPQYTLTKTGVAKRNVAQSFFVTVPAGVKALELGLSGLAAGSQTRFLAFHPYGVPLDNTSTPNCYPNYPADATEGNGCNPYSRAYSNPQPGVWEVLVEARRTSPLLDNPFTLTAKLLGATVDPAVDHPRQRDAGPADAGAVDSCTTIRRCDRARARAARSARRSSERRVDRRRRIAASTRSRCLPAPLGSTWHRQPVRSERRPRPVPSTSRTATRSVDADGDSEESISLADPSRARTP